MIHHTDRLFVIYLSSALAKLAEEDWISFRGRLYELEDLIADWKEKLRGYACMHILHFVVSNRRNNSHFDEKSAGIAPVLLAAVFKWRLK
jgi:hypothetical protein